MSDAYRGGNFLLDRLSPPLLEELRPQLARIEVESSGLLYPGGAERDWERVYFPVGMVGSMLVTVRDGRSIEAGTVGREGIIGVQAIFGSKRTQERWIGQIPGPSYVMNVEPIRRAYEAREELRHLFSHYVQSFMASISQTVACNSLHVLVQRCARWLLMSHDRAGHDQFSLTQEFLAIMLGGAASRRQRRGRIAAARRPHLV